MKKEKSIVFTGGGSGGHIAPIRAVAKDLQLEYSLAWIGSSHFEKDASFNLNIPFYKIHSGKFRRGKSFFDFFKNFIDIFNIIIALFQSFFLLLKLKPQKIFSTGGFVSVPVVVSAFFLRIPVVIHEQTIGFGLANKIASLFASKILLAFPESKQYFNKKYFSKIEFVGNPIREDLFLGNKEGLEQKIGEKFDKQKPIFYITGGGQGSKIINEAVWDILPKLVKDFYVIHQCGKSGIKTGNSFQEKIENYYAFDFIGPELADIYACADVVLARSGAGTVNELDYFGIYSLFVPLRPVQNDEQMKNAKWFLEKNNGEILEQKTFSAKNLEISLGKISFQNLRRHKNKEFKENFSSRRILKNLI